MSPGPNGVLIAKTVPTSGRTVGFANVAGFVTGFYIHGVMAVLGISVILVQSATAFSIIKYLGAVYLCWIGIKALIEAFRGIGATSEIKPANSKRTLVHAYIEGFLTNALNPKVSMFYLAAFPQFIEVGETNATTAFLLVFIHSVLNAIWFSAMVLLLARLTRATRNDSFKRWLKGITGIVFIGFAAKLATYKPNI